jgi:hypothetical protein
VPRKVLSSKSTVRFSCETRPHPLLAVHPPTSGEKTSNTWRAPSLPANSPRGRTRARRRTPSARSSAPLSRPARCCPCRRPCTHQSSTSDFGIEQVTEAGGVRGGVERGREPVAVDAGVAESDGCPHGGHGGGEEGEEVRDAAARGGGGGSRGGG